MSIPSYPQIHQYIAGRWVEGGGVTVEQVLDPATEQVLGSYRHASLADIDAALVAADEALPLWRGHTAEARYQILRTAAGLLRQRSEEAAAILSLEQGKPLSESRMEIQVSADVLDWYAEEGRRAYGRVIPGAANSRLLVVNEPIGAVAAFTPWNFPGTTVARKLGGALAAGCTAIIKASEETAATAVIIFQCLEQAGLPAGVANLLLGIPAEISTRLLSSNVIRKVSLTGSLAVGRVLGHLAVDNDLVTTMELGGNAPVIVFDDVDVEAVARLCATAKFRNAGQVCNVPSRFYVHERIAERFAATVQAFARELRVGPGIESGTQMGPLANVRRLAVMQQLVDDAQQRGADLLAGGKRLQRAGYFFEPSVLANVPDEARVLVEEAFGPIMPITTFSDRDEVLFRANNTPYGLGAFVFTESLDHATYVSDALEAGMVGVNTTVLSRTETPFGGIKASGHGFESGIEGLEAYLRKKVILQHPPVRGAAR